MGKVVKIAISLPVELLEATEQAREARQETRSEFFRHAAKAFLRRERERESVRRYLQGYQEQPETDDEVAAAHQLGSAVLRQEPWE